MITRMGLTKLALSLAIALAAVAALVLTNGGHGSQAGGLQISMTASAANVNVGDTVTFTITVENTGAAEESGIVVDDVLVGPGSIQNALPSQGACTITSPTGLICSMGTLAPGGNATIAVEKLAEASVGGVVELPTNPSSASAASGDSGLPLRLYAAAALAAFVLLLAAGGWYARRRPRR